MSYRAEPHHWMAEALCATHPAEWWDETTWTANALRAKALCDRCPVIEQCADSIVRPIVGIRAGVMHGEVRHRRRIGERLCGCGNPLTRPHLRRCDDCARPPCGTANGARWHYRHGEKPCAACRIADRDSPRRRSA